MKLLVDNDLLHKLLAFDLLRETLDRLGASESDIRILDTARFKFCLGNAEKGRKRYGDVFDKLAETIPRLNVAGAGQPETRDRLTGHVDLDAGEVILLAEAIEDPESFFLTGDKRCIRALNSKPDLAEVCDTLKRRIWCLEALVGHLIDHCGFETVRARIVPNRQRDRTMQSVFGSGDRATLSAVHEALTHYVDDLRKESGSLLAGLPIPPPVAPPGPR
ncbi:MAG: hypothetical protein KF729_06040 [Sandaracinaceae bacterium]|nr:hypothetical protein [Sandaracinaceae bacterium]